MTDVGQLSGGRVKLHAGTLYAALDRLASQGLVESEREEIVDGRLRRYYRLARRARNGWPPRSSACAPIPPPPQRG